MKTKLAVITDSGVFTFMAKMIQIHDTAPQKTSTSRNASSTPSAPPAGRKPRMDPRPMISVDATE